MLDLGFDSLYKLDKWTIGAGGFLRFAIENVGVRHSDHVCECLYPAFDLMLLQLGSHFVSLRVCF